MFKAIIFDCWSTIFCKGVSFTGALSNCLKLENNYDFEKRVGESLMLSPCFDKLEAANRLLVHFSISPEKEIINKVAEILGAPWDAKPYPHTLETLCELKSKGYKLAIISNAFNLTFEEVVSKYDLAGVFDVIIASYEVGLRKPDPKIFEICLKKLRVEKDEALMVGDSLKDDIEAAESFGIKALMLDNKNRHPDYSPRIPSIKDIFSCLTQKDIINQFVKGKVAVFIDAANLESSVKSLGWWIDYVKLCNIFSKDNLVEIRDYCVRHNTDNQDQFFTFLKRNGFTLITKPLKIIKDGDINKGDIRKANFDVEIAVDAMEMQDSFDTFILFSGDSDFDYLLKRLRNKGKIIIVASAKNHISKELIDGSHKYIDLKKLKTLIERKDKK